jgi:hypothetical protein
LTFALLRQWFLPIAKRYPLKATKTRTGAVVYTTLGAVVPLKDIRTQLPQALTTHRFGLTPHAAPSSFEAESQRSIRPT